MPPSPDGRARPLYRAAGNGATAGLIAPDRYRRVYAVLEDSLTR